MAEIIVNPYTGEILAIVQDLLLDYGISVETLKGFCESLEWQENLNHTDFEQLLEEWLIYGQ